MYRLEDAEIKNIHTRSEGFIESLYEEKLKHKEHRNTFVLRKLSFTVALFSIGLVELRDASFYFLFYFIPFVAITYDMYIFAEDFKVKRIGVFIKEKCSNSSTCNDERDWEKWLANHREPFACFASYILTIVVIISSAFIIKYKVYDIYIYNIWLWSIVAIACVVLLYGAILIMRLNQTNQKCE